MPPHCTGNWPSDNQVLLDTNTYLRLAKRILPAVGREFGQVPYVLVILKAVEDEVHPRLLMLWSATVI